MPAVYSCRMRSASATPASPSPELTRPWVYAPMVAALTALVWVMATGLDRPLFFAVHGLSLPPFDRAWASVTLLGDALIAAVLLYPCVRRRPDILWALLFAALLAAVFTHGFKALARTPRPPGVLSPELLHVVGPAHKHRAFPSGHTITAFTTAGVVALSVRGPARWVLLALAALVGVSRVAVGVHWPSDICGGAALGWLSAVAGVAVTHRLPLRTSRAASLVLGAVLTLAAGAAVVLDYTGYHSVVAFQRMLAAALLLWGGTEYVRAWREWLHGPRVPPQP